MTITVCRIYKIIPCLLVSLLFFTSSCLARADNIEKVPVQFCNGDVEFSGTLFLPAGDEISPGVVILHGGSSNVKAHRSTSSYYARRFAQNGIATLIFDKRGTGDSGGNLGECTFDDYVNDAISAVKFLAKHDKTDSRRTGVFGPSQGGRIAALAAARSHDIAFIATIAAPLVSVADLCLFSSLEFLNSMGASESAKELATPLWKKHYACVANGDAQGLKELDGEIDKMYANVDTLFLPIKSEGLDRLDDFQMGDFQPMYNSMRNDYISELSKVKVPWLSIYGEFDQAVPVEASTKIMKQRMAAGGNDDYEINIIPGVGHGFRNVETKDYFPVENIIIDWILAR